MVLRWTSISPGGKVVSRRFSKCPWTGLEFRINSESAWRELPLKSRWASIEISIGNPRCRGRFLECQVHWSKPLFEHVEFSVGDTLRVYNYQTLGHPALGRLSSAEARAVASGEGDEWVRQNENAIKMILGDSDYRIVRWEEWKASPNFVPYFSMLSELYRANEEFRECLLSDIFAYARRQDANAAPLSRPDANRLATYLIEELAVYQIQATIRPTVNVYPGGVMQIFKRMKEFQGMPSALVNRNFVYLEIRASPEGSV
jgi:tRNA-dependent cyclodipeptide synthase